MAKGRDDVARIMSASIPLPGTVQRAASQLTTRNDLSPSLVSTVQFMPSIGFATAKIDKLGLDIRSFRVPLERSIREVMIPSIRRNFDEGGRPAWEPLADATLLMRELHGFSGSDPLIKTGTLRRVATHVNIWTVTPNFAVINDLPQKVWYGKVQQAGTGNTSPFTPVVKRGKARPGDYSMYGKTSTISGRKKPSIPARPFLIIQPEDVIAIEAIFTEWLNMRIAQASWGVMI